MNTIHPKIYTTNINSSTIGYIALFTKDGKEVSTINTNYERVIIPLPVTNACWSKNIKQDCQPWEDGTKIVQYSYNNNINFNQPKSIWGHISEFRIYNNKINGELLITNHFNNILLIDENYGHLSINKGCIMIEISTHHNKL